MSNFPPFHGRPLDEHGRAEALELALASGVHGVYVANALDAGLGETVACWGRDELLALAWFGPRGNLVVVERRSIDAVELADTVQRSRWPWRIALGPQGVVDALARRATGRPLVHRDQVYYGCAPQVASPGGDGDVRPAEAGDRERLMQATLELNRADLRVDPQRVDRRWLREMVETRIRDGSTWVRGPVGAFDCKLDIGSRGPAGVVLEGVFTFPEARGRGRARDLVAAAIARATEPLVCLHVDVANAPARAAYAAAGLRELARCRLLLLG